MADDSKPDFEALPAGTRTRIAGVIAAAVFLFLTLVWLLSGGGTEFFRPKIHIYTYLSDSGGLSPDADVLLNGAKAGKVGSVGLAQSHDPNKAIRVELRIERRFMDNIPVDSIAALTADSLLGDKYVNITVGRAGEHVEDGAEIASLIQSGSFNPADLVSSLQATLQRVDAILTEIQAGKTPTAQFVMGSQLYLNLRDQVESIQHAIQQTAGPKTQLGQMLFSDAFYNQMRQSILNVDHMLEEMQRSDTKSGKFLNDPSAYNSALGQVRNIHASLNDLNSGKGNGALLKSDEQYRKLLAQLTDLNQKIDTLTTGNGKFAQLLKSRELYDSAEAKTKSMGAFLREFREEPRKFERVKLFGKKKTQAKP